MLKIIVLFFVTPISLRYEAIWDVLNILGVAGGGVSEISEGFNLTAFHSPCAKFQFIWDTGGVELLPLRAHWPLPPLPLEAA